MPRLRSLVSVCALGLAATLVPVATGLGATGASADPTGVTLPVLGGATTTTTVPDTTTAPASATTVAPGQPTTPTTAAKGAPSTTTTTKPAKGSPATGVPSVPVGAGPTTTAPKGSAPAPPPDPSTILTAVDDDLDQLSAIGDYQPAQQQVAAAQQKVTQAGAALQTARDDLQRAQYVQAVVRSRQLDANAKLRDMAVAAYVGVGYSTPGQVGASTGDGGTGTVSTPAGLTGVEGLDAQEMLVVVGQRARQESDQADHAYADVTKQAQAVAVGYRRAQAGVGAAEASLLAAQQTLREVTAAALTPGAASATQLPTFSTTGTLTAGPGATTTSTTAAAGGNGSSNPTSPSIIGTPVMTGAEMAAWFASTGRSANTTVPITQLAQDYQQWGQTTGVRDDLAFAQSIVETGFFSFPTGGQLTAKDNNFAGIGACDSCAHGWSFPSADAGVGAQLELLHAYATTNPLPASVPNYVGSVGIGGCCSTWIQLAGKWASSIVYGISIMTVYNQMLSWVIPQRLQSAGLIAASAPAAKGPSLAPLPGSAPASTPKPAIGAASTPASGQTGPSAVAASTPSVGSTSAASLHHR